LGSVNCYLIKTGAGYVLVDTGSSNQRTVLEKELDSAGCQPGNLNLILLTHGDFDHTSNAAYLSKKFGTPIAMHEGDSGMLERGDMFWNRQKGNCVIRKIAPILFRFGKSNRVKPDFYVEDGVDLSPYGFDAKVLSIPGHSKGSIGILTANGDLFCGDLFENISQVKLSSIMDDSEVAKASVEKLKGFEIKIVYPGHGKPFSQEMFLRMLSS
jgi:glyoxylase-like metal-dependent hydrolase (beta-lactamase superfamily II)